MKLLPLIFLVASVSCFSKETLKKRIDKYNWDVKCWGKENMWAGYAAQEKALKECGGVGGRAGAMPTLSTLPVYQSVANQLPVSLMPSYQYTNLPWTQHLVGKRHATYSGVDSQQELADFLGNWFELRSDMFAQVGNLTCVLKHLGLLDSTGRVNLAYITGQYWNTLDLSSTLAGKDPLFRANINNRITDCYNMANAMSPAALLRLNPLFKDVNHCRNMVFFKCSMKATTDCCAAAQLHEILQLRYGQDDGTVNWAQYGLPDNKYELAAASSWILTESLSPVEAAVDAFFTSDGTEM